MVYKVKGRGGKAPSNFTNYVDELVDDKGTFEAVIYSIAQGVIDAAKDMVDGEYLEKEVNDVYDIGKNLLDLSLSKKLRRASEALSEEAPM